MKKLLFGVVIALFVAGCSNEVRYNTEQTTNGFVNWVKDQSVYDTTFQVFCVDGYQYLRVRPVERGGLAQMFEIVETESGPISLPIKCGV